MKIRTFQTAAGVHHFAEHRPEDVGQHHGENPTVSGPHPSSKGYRTRQGALEAALVALGPQIDGIAGSGSEVRRWARERGLAYQDIRRGLRPKSFSEQRKKADWVEGRPARPITAPNSTNAPALRRPGEGGLSIARQQALAAAQRAQRAASAKRRATLSVPAPFSTAQEFLAVVRQIARSLPEGTNRELADLCGVNNSTAGKWLRGKKVPQQASLDKIVEWWRLNRDRAGKLAPDQAPTTTPRPPAKISIARLPEDISARLKRTARLRNLDPISYAAQILDRHLPPWEDLQ